MGSFHEHWDGERLRLFEPERGVWLIQCGEGRYDADRRNAAFSKRTGVALNFWIRGDGEIVEAFGFCIAWEGPEWMLLFHRDPARADWPDHPEHHLQFAGPASLVEKPPFMDWRIPFGETGPERILEYIVHQIR